MSVEHRPSSLYNNDGFSPVEMNTISPAVPKIPSGGPKNISYALEKFENAHITLFQVKFVL